LYPWFERHQHALGRGLAAELALNAAQAAVYHVLGAPGIASLTAACLTADRAIAIGELERLVRRDGDTRQRLLSAVAAELYGREQDVSLSELLAELDGEDMDRVLEAIALLKRRRSTSSGSPDDLWTRAAEPAREPGGGSRSAPDAYPVAALTVVRSRRTKDPRYVFETERGMEAQPLYLNRRARHAERARNVGCDRFPEAKRGRPHAAGLAHLAVRRRQGWADPVRSPRRPRRAG
jgi:hypothetical protein